MTDHSSKSIAIKFVGAKRATETVTIVPGVTVADVLATLKLDRGFQLSDAKNPDIVFRSDDVLYALVQDGDLLYASALIDAGG